MPTLNWIGKEAVVDHHRRVPLRLLECDPKLSAGDPEAGNLLIQGDNLEALKALLPRYKGQVKCIYIDPPYNTGNEGWIYNDNVNDPRIKKWLGDVVGKEAEDLCRHDKWLCMMYPRLALLREFLNSSGLIFVNIGSDELGHLELIMDEIFGSQNRVAVAAWETAYTANQTAKHISETTDFVLIYANYFELATVGKFERTGDQLAKFKNPDADKRGPWKAENLSAGKFYSAGQFEIIGPTGTVFRPPPGRFWRCNQTQYMDWLSDGRITFGKSGTGRPMLKKYRDELTTGLTPTTWWRHEEFGTAKDASTELKEIFGGQAAFATPKPTKLLQRILEIATDGLSIVIDSFGGSGTTGHAVLKMNAAGSHRKFILVEVLEDIALNVTAKRLQRVIEGYTNSKGESVEGLGGGFRFCRLGKTLFDEQGEINQGVPFVDLARYVYLIETGMPVPTRPRKDSALLGVHEGRAIYLLYNGVLGDKRPAGGNVLTHAVLDAIPPHPADGGGPRFIFGQACRLSEATLARLNVTFRQTPYALREE